MFDHMYVNFTNVYYFFDLHYYTETIMLDLIERTRILIANHPEYMRVNIPRNIPGGHGQRLTDFPPNVHPYYKKLCSFDMSPEFANQIMFAQDFKINANKILVLQSTIDAIPALRPTESGKPVTLTCDVILDAFNKLVNPSTASVRRYLNQAEVKVIMSSKLLVPTIYFYNFFIETLNKFMVRQNVQDPSLINFSFDTGIMSINSHSYNVFKHYIEYIKKMKT